MNIHKLAIFPGADHMFSHKEHRQQVSELVVEWFKKHTSEKTGKTDGRLPITVGQSQPSKIRHKRMDFFETFNADFIDGQYEQWKADPNAVSSDWRFFFQGFELAGVQYGEAEPVCDEEQALRQSGVHSTDIPLS